MSVGAAADDADRERIGLLCAALCALNGAFVPAMAKLTTNLAPPVYVATVTTIFGGLFAAAVLVARGKSRALLGARTGWRLALVGALGTGVAFTLFYSGARRSTAVETALCLQIEPLYSLLAAWAFLGHRPDRRRVLATAALLAGILLAIGWSGFSGSSGVWFLLATPLCWQASHLVVLRGLIGVRPQVLTAARYVYGSVALVLYGVLSGELALPERHDFFASLPLLALQGLVLSYLGTLVWYQAVVRLDLARTTAIVVPSIPLLSFGASFAILGEVPTANQWAGMALVAAGVLAFASAPEPTAGRLPRAAGCAHSEHRGFTP